MSAMNDFRPKKTFDLAPASSVTVRSTKPSVGKVDGRGRSACNRAAASIWGAKPFRAERGRSLTDTISW